MIRDEFDLLLRSKMKELGMDEEWVLNKLKASVEVAEEKMDAANMIRGVTEVGKLLRMYPDQKINQRGLTPLPQNETSGALPSGHSLLDEVNKEWQEAQVIRDEEMDEATSTHDSME